MVHQLDRWRGRGRLLVAAAVASAVLGGCGAVEDVRKLDWPFLTTTGRRLPVSRVDGRIAPRRYPTDATVGEPVKIEVIPVGKAVRFDNRTGHRFEDVEVWLNHQYGASVDAIPIGRSDPIALASFVNEHGERYPTARFLQPERRRPLVLADLLVDGTIRKMTVRLSKTWDVWEGGAGAPTGTGTGRRTTR